jgi:hypothetical protein
MDTQAPISTLHAAVPPGLDSNQSEDTDSKEQRKPIKMPSISGVGHARLETAEEKAFIGALMCILQHFEYSSMGPQTMEKAAEMIKKTRTKIENNSLNSVKWGANVEIWLFLSRIFSIAEPSFKLRALGPETTSAGGGYPESTNLIIEHSEDLGKDLNIIITLVAFADAVLRGHTKLAAQDITATAMFQETIHDLLKQCVCLNTITKGPDENCSSTPPDALDNVIDIHELCMTNGDPILTVCRSADPMIQSMASRSDS